MGNEINISYQIIVTVSKIFLSLIDHFEIFQPNKQTIGQIVKYFTK